MNLVAALQGDGQVCLYPDPRMLRSGIAGVFFTFAGWWLRNESAG